MLFSIIIPIYNVSGFISRGIECILNQTFEDFEVILINDGSTDNSGQLCDEFALKDRRLHIIHQKNSGAGPARNAGINAARGRYVVFFDIDDLIHFDALMRIKNVIEEHSPQLIIFGYNEIDSETLRVNNYQFNEAVISSNDDLKAIYVDEFLGLRFNNGFVWNKVYELAFLKHNSIEFEPLRIQQDEVFNLSVYPLVDKVVAISDVLYDYFVYQKGNTRSFYINDRMSIYLRVRNAFLDINDNWGLNSNQLERYAHKRYINSAIYCITFNLFHKDNPCNRTQRKSQLKTWLESDSVQQSILWIDDKEFNWILSHYYKAIRCKSVKYFMCINYIDNMIKCFKSLVRKIIY